MTQPPQYNLNLLVTFSTLTETQSFSECAKRLRCSQPTVSRQIRELEEQLGRQLFLRDRHRVELTREGQRLRRAMLPHLTEVLRSLAPAEEASGAIRGRLRFGTLAEVGKSTFMAMLLKFQQQYAEVQLEVSYTEEADIRERLRAGTLDFGVLSEAASLENIRGYKLFDERIVLLTRASNTADPLGGAARKLGFVTYHADDPLFEQFRRRLPKKSAQALEIRVCVNSHPSMIEALEKSDTYAVMPYFSARKAIESKRLRVVPGYELARPLHLAHHDNPHESERDRLFRKFMIEECRRLRK